MAAAAESTPCCEFAWIAESGFDFIALERSLTLVKETVGARSLISVALEARPKESWMVVFFRLSSRAYSSQLRKVMGMEAVRLRCRALDLLLLAKPEREALQTRRAELPVKVEASVDLSKGVRDFQEALGLKPVEQPPVRFRMSFETVDALCALYAQQAAEGAVHLPGKSPPRGTQLLLELAVTGQTIPGVVDSRAQVLEPAKGGPPSTFRVRLDPSNALRELVTRHALSKKEGRLARGGAGQQLLREHQRFDTFLDVEFKELPELSAEYATNISKGGLFVRMPHPPVLRSKVKLRLKLPSGEQLETEAEVVHTVSVEEAAARGQVAGAGLSFATGRPEFDEKIAGLLESYGRRKPLVLIVDADRAFAQRLEEAFVKEGMEVETAHEGGEAIRKVVDRFFDLDLLLLDVKAPELGAEQLLHRIRNLGGELDLPVIAFAPPPGPPGATEVLSRETPLPQLLDRVRRLVHHREQS